MKRQILDKATEMYLTYGFKSVTMDDIANEMAISKKTIYQHFSNKTALVKAVTNHLFDTISCGIDTIIQSETNPIEELFEIKRFVLSNLKNESSAPIFQLQKYYPKIHSQLKSKQFEKMGDCVVENIQKGIQQGLYRKDLNIEFVSRMYFAGMNSIKDVDLFPTESFTPKENQDLFLEYHIRAICTDKGLQKLEELISINK